MHLDAAYNLARWLSQDPADAEDIILDVWLRATQSATSIRNDNVKVWLLLTVRDIAYAKLRVIRPRIEMVLGNPGKDNEGMNADGAALEPRTRLATTHEPAKLQAAVSALPIDLRECLILREIEDLSYQEIAWITRVSIGTVMSRLYQARQQLAAS